MESTFWRHWWWNGGYFGAIYGVKGLLPKATVRFFTLCSGSWGKAGQTKQGELGNNLLAGTVGGFVGTTLNTPCTFVQTEKKTKLISAVDVVKSRVQLKGTGEWYAPFLCLGQS